MGNGLQPSPGPKDYTAPTSTYNIPVTKTSEKWSDHEPYSEEWQLLQQV